MDFNYKDTKISEITNFFRHYFLSRTEVNSDYYQFGEWQADPSRKYGKWFPNLTFAFNKGEWAASLDYTCKTTRPSYNSLRYEVQYDNRYMYEGGNPY